MDFNTCVAKRTRSAYYKRQNEIEIIDLAGDDEDLNVNALEIPGVDAAGNQIQPPLKKSRLSGLENEEEVVTENEDMDVTIIEEEVSKDNEKLVTGNDEMDVTIVEKEENKDKEVEEKMSSPIVEEKEEEKVDGAAMDTCKETEAGREVKAENETTDGGAMNEECGKKDEEVEAGREVGAEKDEEREIEVENEASPIDEKNTENGDDGATKEECKEKEVEAENSANPICEKNGENIDDDGGVEEKVVEINSSICGKKEETKAAEECEEKKEEKTNEQDTAAAEPLPLKFTFGFEEPEPVKISEFEMAFLKSFEIDSVVVDDGEMNEVEHGEKKVMGEVHEEELVTENNGMDVPIVEEENKDDPIVEEENKDKEVEEKMISPIVEEVEEEKYDGSAIDICKETEVGREVETKNETSPICEKNGETCDDGATKEEYVKKDEEKEVEEENEASPNCEKLAETRDDGGVQKMCKEKEKTNEQYTTSSAAAEPLPSKFTFGVEEPEPVKKSECKANILGTQPTCLGTEIQQEI